MDVTTKRVLAYGFLPGFIPRLRELWTSGFANIAFTMAQVYAGLRLLPTNHPYLQAENFGRFGIRHVIAQAANNLVFSRKNIDQILVFTVLLVGVVLLFAQFGFFIFALIFGSPAMAQNMDNIFMVSSVYNPGPAHDIVFMILDRIFGVSGIFNSCVSDPAVLCLNRYEQPMLDLGPFPTPFHVAMHKMMHFYSLGIFLVSVFIIIYYVTFIVADTATKGIPFGDKINKTWVPVRLVLFFALLIPLSSTNATTGEDEVNKGGLNVAQIITLWTVKSGSNFATNAWGMFNETLTTTYLGYSEDLIAKSKPPQIAELVQFMFLAKTCKLAEEMYNLHGDSGIQAYILPEQAFDGTLATSGPMTLESAAFDDALERSNMGDITVRFGAYDPELYGEYKGAVSPFCGEVKMNITNLIEPASQVTGAYGIQQLYYILLQEMWIDRTMTDYANCMVRLTVNGDQQDPSCLERTDNDFALDRIEAFQQILRDNIPDIVDQAQANGDWNVPESLRRQGWGGAAIWYNRVAQMNGDVANAVLNIPKPRRYPIVLERISEFQSGTAEDINPENIFNPASADGKLMDFENYTDLAIAIPMVSSYKFWVEKGNVNSNFTAPSGNIFIDGINLLLGSSGLFSLQENRDIHPLAKLSVLGKSIMDASIRNIGAGIFGSLVSKLASNTVTSLAGILGGFLDAIGRITITVGFVLYYIIPAMPFVYFLFAITTWVKSIFEAMVAMPLWAMSFLRVDGEGIPGKAGANALFLLLEIFLRPILIVFGLIASIAIFAASINVLNEIFDIVVLNVTGYDMEAPPSAEFTLDLEFIRSPVDKFLYTVIYAIIAYSLAVSCFKLIDAIPNNILRYSGAAGLKTYSELDPNPAQNLISLTTRGGAIVTTRLQGGTLAAVIS